MLSRVNFQLVFSLVFSIILLCQNVKAQEVLTETKAIQIALAKNPDFQVVLKEIGLAKADLTQAKILENPIIFGDFAFYNLPDSFKPSIGMQKNITDLILRPIKTKVAKEKLAQIENEVEFAVINLILDLRTTYYNYLAAKQNYDLHKDLLLAAEIESEFAIEQKKVGNINTKEFNEHQIVLTKAKTEFIESTKDYQIAKTELIRVLGLNTPDFNYDESLLVLENLPDKEIQEAELDKIALTNRTDLLAQREEIKSLESSKKLAKLKIIPPITLGAEFHSEPDGTAWAPIIQTELPIFNRNQAERLRFSSLLEQSKSKLESKTLDIKTQVKVAYAHLITDRNIAESYSKLLIEQNKNLLEFTELKYNYMLADIYDLLEIKTHVLDAEIAQVESLKKYWISRAYLERTIGMGLLKEQKQNEISQDL